MLKVTKVQPIATHRDYTRQDKGNFQEIYCKAQESCGILCAQDGNYRAVEEAVQRCGEPGWDNDKGVAKCDTLGGKQEAPIQGTQEEPKA